MATANVSSSVTIASNTSLLTISKVSNLNTVRLPEVSIHGIPWAVKICKKEGAHQSSLAAYLYCEKDVSSCWAHAAVCSFELLSFGDDRNSIKCHSIPYVFVPSEFGIGYGKDDIIQWDELFNEDKNYVMNDAIKLRIKITAEDPNQANKSSLKFERVVNQCNCEYVANFRLTVEHVVNLMAVRSAQFKLRGMAFVLTVFKDHTSQIGVLLECEAPSEDVSCKVTMLAKLVSSKADGSPMDKIGTKRLRDFDELALQGIVSLNEVLKPENGFVNNNSVVFDIEIKTDKPETDMQNSANGDAAPKLECSICLANIINEEISCTPCGHTFCSACIEKAVEDNGECPLCKEAVQPDDLRRIVLPM